MERDITSKGHILQMSETSKEGKLVSHKSCLQNLLTTNVGYVTLLWVHTQNCKQK
jgi:hypothetical protein